MFSAKRAPDARSVPVPLPCRAPDDALPYDPAAIRSIPRAEIGLSCDVKARAADGGARDSRGHGEADWLEALCCLTPE